MYYGIKKVQADLHSGSDDLSEEIKGQMPDPEDMEEHSDAGDERLFDDEKEPEELYPPEDGVTFKID